MGGYDLPTLCSGKSSSLPTKTNPNSVPPRPHGEICDGAARAQTPLDNLSWGSQRFVQFWFVALAANIGRVLGIIIQL